jgi:hypothetical protein
MQVKFSAARFKHRAVGVRHALQTALLLITVVITIAPSSARAQLAGASLEDQARNRSYLHPLLNRAVVPRPDDAQHPPPPVNGGPKTPPGKPVERAGLPRQIPAGLEKEDPENLRRQWESRRSTEELQRAASESLAMPGESHAAGQSPAATPPRAFGAARPPAALAPALGTDGWEQIGYGDFNPDDVHHQAGRIRQASYAYDNAQGITTLWVGATGGGLWRALDLFFAIAFVPVSDNLPGSPSVGAFLVQPGNSNNILIGTGDISRYAGTGMYKTTDGGATWHAVHPTDGTSWPGTFQKVLTDLGDATHQTVLAQGDSGIWLSNDFGSSWSQVYKAPTTDLVQDPVHTYIWYAASPGIGVLRSTSYGQFYNPIGSGLATPGRISLAVSAAAPQHLYAISATTDNKYLSGIWRSDDYGDGTWNLIESNDHISGAAQAFHTTTIAVDPTNPDIVFAGMAGSQVTHNGTAASPTWTYSGSFDEGHADHTGYTFEAGTTNVISTTDGGIYVLDENTLSVSGSLNYATNLNVQQVYGPVGDLACSRTEPDECLSGLQDNGSITINRNDSPPNVIRNGGDGAQVSIAPNDPNELFNMEDGTRFYSTDGGATWSGDYGACLPNNYYATTLIDQTPPNGFTPFIYTFSQPPNTQNSSESYVYYKSVNPNCDWTAANPNAPFDMTKFSPRSMDASTDPSGYVFYVVGWSTGALKVLDSHNTGDLGAMTYVDRTPPLSSHAEKSDSQIAADRSTSRPYTVTYTTGGSRPSQAFLSNDRGQTWTEVTGDLASKLPDASYWKLLANPIDQRQLFLATDQGIYRSDNFGANWYRYMAGMPAIASIFGLELDADPLYVSTPLLHIGTYGRGYWDRLVAPDAVLSAVSATPATIVGGQSVEVGVDIDRGAPADLYVNLTSSNPAVLSLPASIPVAQGYHDAALFFPTAQVSATTHVVVSASYNGVQYSTTVTVTPPHATATTLGAAPNPAKVDESVTLTAHVSSTSGSPAGTVTFYDGAIALATSTLSGGTATLKTSALGAGTHAIAAAYNGATPFGGSRSPTVSEVIVKLASATTLGSSRNPSPFGESLVFTATVTSPSGTPTGTVEFKDGALTLGSASLSGGKASFTTALLKPGSHSVTAAYQGTGTFSASASTSVAETIDKASATTILAATPNPSSFDQSVHLTATVKSSTSGIPAGTVEFLDGASSIGTKTLDATGSAGVTTSTLNVGTHSITAVYAGNADFLKSTSAKHTVTVKKAATTSKLSSSLNPAKHGNKVTFTAKISPAYGGSPTGTVTFKDGAATIGSGSVGATTHSASFATSSLAVGTHHITADYAGDKDYSGSNSTVLDQVVQ